MRRLVLITLLLASAAHAQTVLNFGIGGQTSAEGRARFLHDIAPTHPRFILIYFGMNDAENDKKFLPLPDFINNMRWMIDTARQLHAMPIISTIQHVDPVRVLARHRPETYGAEGPNGKIDRYDAALIRLAHREHVPIADFRRALDQAGGPTAAISTDGVHLYPLGYHLLAETFAKQIRAQLHHHPLRPTDTIACIGDSLTYGVGVRTTTAGEDLAYPAQLQKILSTPTATK